MVNSNGLAEACACQLGAAPLTQLRLPAGTGPPGCKDLGISSIRLLASARLTYVGLAGSGIEITGTEMMAN